MSIKTIIFSLKQFLTGNIGFDIYIFAGCPSKSWEFRGRHRPLKSGLLALPLTLAWMVLMGFSPLPLSAQADQVLYCHDGDTCLLVGPLGEYKVRLFGVDAPEIKQAYGEAARDFLNGLIQGKEVDARCKGRSFYRQTCDLFYQGQDVSAVLAENGFAWDYPKYSKGLYAQEEYRARQKSAGLWAGTPISPHCFRHKNCITPELEP